MKQGKAEVNVVSDQTTELYTAIMHLLDEYDVTIDNVEQVACDGLSRLTLSVDISDIGCSRTKLSEELTNCCTP
ncbi:hypothetical protein, partial [Haloferax profundi]|uniref:hypothetical protein n=1 Tax=Haloferax profundi TaxID=1544718 RepID=UPI001E2CDC41